MSVPARSFRERSRTCGSLTILSEAPSGSDFLKCKVRAEISQRVKR